MTVDDYQRGWRDCERNGYDLSHADRAAIRSAVNAAEPARLLCDACARPVDEDGCQWTTVRGLSTHVHVITPLSVAQQLHPLPTTTSQENPS